MNVQFNDLMLLEQQLQKQNEPIIKKESNNNFSQCEHMIYKKNKTQNYWTNTKYFNKWKRISN